MNQTLKRVCMSVITVTLLSVPSFSSQDSLFYVPEILKDNVAFWKKIYSEVTLSEGLIHDREYPMVIYQKLSFSSIYPDDKKIRSAKETVIEQLKRLANDSESSWNEKDKELAATIRAHAPEEALKGAFERVRFQQGQKDRFMQGLIKSGMYLDTIRTILRQYEIPERLAYLPHVESSFNAEAYSKVGAAGLWQFMRGTARLYGMTVNYVIDERRDPIKSSVAAAKYLSSSYRELKSWPLAITSYNHGVYGMKRAVNQVGSNDLADIVQKYESRSFRFASSNFYSCFLAASEIAHNYTAYFPNLQLEKPVRYAVYTLDHFMTPHVLCDYLSLSKEQILDLNPSIRPAAFTQKKSIPKGFVIHLPPDYSPAKVKSAIARVPDSLKLKEDTRPQYYEVSRGDNLYTIASRLGVSVQELASENNINRLNVIRAGQVLRVPSKPVPIVASNTPSTVKEAPKKVKPAGSVVPVAADTAKVDPEAIVEMAAADINVQSQLNTEEPDTTVVLKPAPVETPVVKKEPVVEKVVKSEPVAEVLNDTLKAIALTPAIPKQNVSDKKAPTISADFDVSMYMLDVRLSAVGNSAEIHVSIDETVGHYADWLGVGASRIRKLNDMGRNSQIRIGRKLHIPVSGKDALEKFVAARLEYHMSIEEDFYTQYKVSETKSRTMRKGETLWNICNEGDVVIPLWLFKKYNTQLDLAKIQPGIKVWIPTIQEISESELQKKSAVSPDSSAKNQLVRANQSKPSR